MIPASLTLRVRVTTCVWDSLVGRALFELHFALLSRARAVSRDVGRRRGGRGWLKWQRHGRTFSAQVGEVSFRGYTESKLVDPRTTFVQGVLKDDGTLELDEKPQLAPGRVQVTIVAIPEPPVAARHRTILEVLDEIQAGQQARGYRGRTVEEMEADEAERRAEDEEYEERWRAIWRQTSPDLPDITVEVLP
jgi:hypothetical protein